MNFKEKQDLISNYFSRINILYRKVSKQYNLTYNTMLVLYILKLRVPCTQKEIVEEWEIPKQTVNTVIKDLEEKEYIRFSFDHNKKEKTIFLTDLGKNIISASIDDILKLEERFYETIGEEDCDVVLRVLETYFQMFEEELAKKQEKI